MKNRDLLLWTAILAGPLIWLLSFGANFALAPWACALRWKPALYVISAVALALTAGSGLLAWSEWNRLGRDLPGEGGGAIPRARIMAIWGLLLSGISFLVILGQAIVEIMLGACQ